MVQMAEQPLQVVFKAFSAKEQAGTGKYEPVLVCTEMGRGRGVNLVLGHDAAAMGAGFRTLLLRSAEWAATGQVTLPPPAIWPSTPAAMTAAGIDLDATFSAVARYRYGDERKPLHALQQLVLYANSLAGNDPQGFRGASGGSDGGAADFAGRDARSQESLSADSSPTSPRRSRPRR